MAAATKSAARASGRRRRLTYRRAAGGGGKWFGFSPPDRAGRQDVHTETCLDPFLMSWTVADIRA
jgi:hypothetical protein